MKVYLELHNDESGAKVSHIDKDFYDSNLRLLVEDMEDKDGPSHLQVSIVLEGEMYKGKLWLEPQISSEMLEKSVS